MTIDILADVRFIPTGVGNTHASLAVSVIVAVHPHRRGEHAWPSNCRMESSGSSPQAWGTRVITQPTPIVWRFIPTGVGNTLLSIKDSGWSAVHPHRRGEHMFVYKAMKLNPGSSPQAWGTQLRTKITYCNLRFIPTGVGNTVTDTTITMSMEVHPHRRGEHLWQLSNIMLTCGSSPQAWGTL